MVTGPTYQPAEFLVPTTVSVMVGPVLSMLTPMVVVAVLPALSVAVPVTIWFSPSPVTVTGLVQRATPDSESEQVNVTITSPLFQPRSLAAIRVAVITGTLP